MGFGQDDAKGHGQAIDIPGDDEQGETDAEKPVLMFGVAPFLGEGVLLGAFGFMAAIANDINDAVVGRRQLRHHIVGKPFNDQVDRPITGFEQASQAPFGNLLRTPASQLVQGFSARIDRMHDDQPA